MNSSTTGNRRRWEKAGHHLSFFTFSVLAGVITTLWGYNYGTGNQIEQLPIVMRAIDPGFLTNDFFTNASASFGPRLYFASFIAFFCQWFSLPNLYFALTAAGNILIALVSAHFARDLFDGSRSAGLLSAAAVLGLKSFWLGASNTVYQTYLDPSHLIMPLLLLSIWAGIRRKIVISVVFSGIASLIHPLMGMETGAILLGVNVFFLLLEMKKSPQNSSRFIRIKEPAAAFGLYLLFSIPSILPYVTADHISSTQFIEIVAYLRHPHHYLPGTFGMLQYIQAFAFLAAAAIAFYQAKRESVSFATSAQFIAVMSIFLVLLCSGAYLFVEIFPSRLWVTAQIFRLLYIIKWSGLVILAGNWSRQSEIVYPADRLSRYTTLLSFMSPPSLAITHCFELLKENIRRFSALFSSPVSNTLFLLGILLMLVLYRVEARVYLLFPLFLIMAAVLLKLPAFAGIMTSLLCALCVAVPLLNDTPYLPDAVQSLIEKPLITLADLQDDSSDVAAYALHHTPENALFIVPPKMGEFRYTARRAIVVDFKAFPFQDEAMLEWQHRLYACYGAPASGGWQAETDMSLEYRHINDERLGELQQVYGIDYAVLYTDTKTALPVIFEGQFYKIVSINS